MYRTAPKRSPHDDETGLASAAAVFVVVNDATIVGGVVRNAAVGVSVVAVVVVLAVVAAVVVFAVGFAAAVAVAFVAAAL